jgi:hypothetical protein
VSEPTREVVIPFSAEMIGAVSRASARSADSVHEEMKEGLNSLANIAYIAPWLGLFATVLTIPNSFVAFNGPASLGLALCADGLSRSIWPMALGLLVGLISLSFHIYLNGALDTFDCEMKCTCLDLVNQLARYRGRWIAGPPMKPVGSGPIFGAEPAKLAQEHELSFGSMLFTGAAIFLAWCLQVFRYFEHDYLPLASAPWAACKYVLFVFGVSCTFAYVVWVKLLRRGLGALAIPAAASCLVWCLAELVLRVHLR